MRSLSLFKMFSVIAIILLTAGCTPKFNIESYDNSFRGTSVCNMQNNIVKKHNTNGTINFNLQKNTEFNQPYSLLITVFSVYIAPTFRNDSYALITLTSQGKTETLKLKSSESGRSSYHSHHHTPGYTIDGIYYAGTSYTENHDFSVLYISLSKEQSFKIANADQIFFKIETTGPKPLEATLSSDNIKNLRTFSNTCLSD